MTAARKAPFDLSRPSSIGYRPASASFTEKDRDTGKDVFYESTYAYDDSGHLTSILQTADGVPDNRTDISYDAAGRMEVIADFYNWDRVEPAVWEAGYETRRTFDSSGRVVQEINTSQPGHAGTYAERMTYDRDSSGLIVSVSRSSRGAPTEEWTLELRIDYSYDVTGRRTGERWYFVPEDSPSADLKLSQKATFGYTNAGILSSIVYEALVDQKWVLGTELEMAYNEWGWMDSSFMDDYQYDVQTETAEWVAAYDSWYTYDDDGFLVLIEDDSESHYEDPPVHREITTRVTWERGTVHDSVTQLLDAEFEGLSGYDHGWIVALASWSW